MENVTAGHVEYTDDFTTATTTTASTTRFLPTSTPTSSTTEALNPILDNKYTVLIVLTVTLVPACCILLCCIRAFVASRLRRTHPLVGETKKPPRRRANNYKNNSKSGRTRPALTKSYVNTWSVANYTA